jgi:hypothetical protein
MILQSNYLIQNEERFPERSAAFVSIPTPFGGRRDASSGRGWADYRVRDTLGSYSNNTSDRIFPDEKNGNLNRRGSAPAGAAAPVVMGVWGHQPPSKHGNNFIVVKNRFGARL